MVSRNAICFQAVNIVYRHAVVGHIRNVLTTTYPDEWEAKLSAPFKKEWDQVRTNALSVRKTGEFETPLTDDFDLLSVNHFYNLFELYFEDLFPPSPKDSPEDRKRLRQAVLMWSRNIKQLRDPVTGHPSEVDVLKTDASVMLDSARRLLKAIDPEASTQVEEMWETVVSDEPDLGDEGFGDHRVLEASTLPPREMVAPSFVGRQEDLRLLDQWLGDQRSRIKMLVGDGGKGKTAIAYEFAVATLNEPPTDLEIIIWLSAKARRFVEGSAVDVESPDFWNLDSALDWVLRAYGAVDIDLMDLSAKEYECLEYLSKLPALVVLDDVDSLEGQNVDAMNFFIHRTHMTPSKFLLTSRRIPFGMEPNVTEVQGFNSGDDGVRFINSRVSMFGLEPDLFTRRVMNRILEACDGSPLFIQDLLRLCTVGETTDSAIRVWRDRGGENARRYALGREFDMLSGSARRVLLTCALFGGAVSLPEIRVVSELTDEDCRSAIQELQRLFLLPRAPLSGDEPRFALNVNTRQLVLDVEGASDLSSRLKAVIDETTGQRQISPARRKRFGGYIRQAVSLAKLRNYSTAETTLLDALSIYPESPELHGTLGWVYKNWSPRPRYTDARERFERAADLRATREDTYWHWSLMEQLQSEWTAAAEAAERGIELLPKSERLSYMAGLSRSRLAKDLYQQAQYGRSRVEALKAEGYLKTALVDLEVLRYGQYDFHSRVYRATAINYEYLVRISGSLQDHDRERQYLRRLSGTLRSWTKEHPQDTIAASEQERLTYWFGHLMDGFNDTNGRG